MRGDIVRLSKILDEETAGSEGKMVIRTVPAGSHPRILSAGLNGKFGHRCRRMIIYVSGAWQRESDYYLILLRNSVIIFDRGNDLQNFKGEHSHVDSRIYQ